MIPRWVPLWPISRVPRARAQRGPPGGGLEIGIYRNEEWIDSAFDNQPVLHLEDRLCREQEHSLQNEYTLDNQPVLFLQERLCRGQKYS